VGWSRAEALTGCGGAGRQVAREYELEVLREKMEWMRRVEEAEEHATYLKDRAQHHVRSPYPPASSRVRLASVYLTHSRERPPGTGCLTVRFRDVVIELACGFSIVPPSRRLRIGLQIVPPLCRRWHRRQVRHMLDH